MRKQLKQKNCELKSKIYEIIRKTHMNTHPAAVTTRND